MRQYTQSAGEIQLQAAEAVLLDYLKSGNVTLKSMAEAEAECHQMIEEIRQQVAKK